MEFEEQDRMECRSVEESLDEMAARLEVASERLVEQLSLLAEDVHRLRWTGSTSTPKPAAGETITERPEPLAGLPEAEAVLDYKVQLRQGIRWLSEDPRLVTDARIRSVVGQRFAEVLGEDVWQELLLLWQT